MRTHVFGDTGGHLAPLLQALLELGLDKDTLKLPEDIQIVHGGDLIHKGPHSEKLVELVDKIIRVNPGQWIQLMGNHELQYFDGAYFFWRQTIDLHARTTLWRWKDEGVLKVAHGIEKLTEAPNLFPDNLPAQTLPDKPVLITHAGLGYNFWQQQGAIEEIGLLVETLNSCSVKELSQAGLMLDVGIHTAPSPIWAHGTEEVWDSWHGRSMPFINIHGHTSPYNFPSRQVFETPKEFVDNTVVNSKTRVLVTEVGGSLEVFTDPGYSATTDQAIQPSLQLISI